MKSGAAESLVSGGPTGLGQAKDETLGAIGRITDRVGPQKQLRADVARLLSAESRVKAVIEEGVEGWVADFPTSARSAAMHLIAAGGKRVRPVLTLLAARAAGGRDEQALPVAVAVELLHNGTLLHDDVIDEAAFRRGRPAAQTVFGNSLAVLAGDFCYFAALDSLIGLGDLAILSRSMEVARALSTGELIQLERRGRAVRLSEADCLEVIDNKTGSLFSFGTYGGAKASQADPAIVDGLDQYGRLLGRAFQIVDDVLDYTGDAATTGKGVLHDLAEGVVTLPLALAMERDEALWPRVTEAVTRFGQGQGDVPDAWTAEIVDRVQNSGALDQCRASARRASEEAVAALDSVAPSVWRDALEILATALIDRRA